MKISISPRRLEAEDPMQKYENGKAYIYARGDDSIMVNVLHEMLSENWYAETWYDLNRNDIRKENKVSCLFHPLKDGEVQTDNIAGTYLIDDETLNLIEQTVDKAFNTIIPFIEGLNENVLYFWMKDKNNLTYVLDNKLPYYLEPGTCVYRKNSIDGISHLFKIRNKVTETIRSSNVNQYVSESFTWDFCDSNRIGHRLNNTFLTFKTKPTEIDLGCKDFDYNYTDYIIPISVYHQFEEAYIKAVNDVQILRSNILQTIIKNHRELYGEEAAKKAEENICKWIKT